MTVGLVSIGAAVDLLDASFSGFAYPNNASVVPILPSAAGSGGNAVLQQSGFPWRQATLSVLAEEANRVLLRGYYETRELVTFTDFDGTTSSIRVFDFAQSMRMAGLWDLTLTLLEITPPVAGS